jgi:hypothetical protein
MIVCIDHQPFNGATAMAKDYLTLGPTPADETCIGLGAADYATRGRKEMRIYRKQLERQFPDLPDGVYFTIKGFPHDFGTYHEVCVVYDDSDESACSAAYNVENNIPAKWDDQARIELGPTIDELINDLPADLSNGPTSKY